MDELNSIIEQLCSRSDALKRHVRQISRVLLEVACYTYANYYTKLGEHKLAAVYTLYLTYSRDMLRDMAMTVAAMDSKLSMWTDMFLIISAAHMLHVIRETREAPLVLEESVERPRVQIVVNLSDYMRIVKVHKEMLIRLTSSAETYDLILSAMTLSVGYLLLMTYLCACQEGEDEVEHVRRVIDYAMTEDSKKILSDYYNNVVCEIGR